MNKSIGKILKEARLKKGLKQIEVAQKAGISQPYYNLIENDKSRPPSFYAIEKIAHVLGRDPKPLIKILEYKQLEYKTMEPEFKEGEYVVIAPNIQWENGDYVAVVNPKGEAALKKIRKNKDHMLLIPENPKYEPIVLNKDEDPRVIGKVVRKIKKY